MDLDPNLIALFVQYVGALGADLTRDGIGRLARRFGRQDQVEPDPGDLNLSIQAALQERGVPVGDAIKVADFVLKSSNLSYLILLHYTAAESVSVKDESIAESTSREYRVGQFRAELRAHLVLEAAISDPQSLDTAVDCIELILAGTWESQLRRAQRRAFRVSPGRPPANLLFAQSDARLRTFELVGQPDLAAILDYTLRYLDAARSRYGTVDLQHLGQDHPPIAIRDLYVQPTFRPRSGERGTSFGIRTLLRDSQRAVVLGPAGAGKSTLVRFIASTLCEPSDDLVVPLVVELRRYKPAKKRSPLFIDFLRTEATGLVQSAPPPGWIEYLLLSGRGVVFFDGFDEVLNLGDRARVRDAIRSFSLLYPASNVLVTSRVQGYGLAPFPNDEYMTAHVSSLTEPKVEEYASKWFTLRRAVSGAEAEVLTSSFLEESGKYATGLRTNPLMLSLLCSVYYHKGGIPESMADLYDRCADMLFRQWDSIREVERSQVWDRDLRPALFYLAHVIITSPEYRGEGVPENKLQSLLTKFWVDESGLDADEARDNARNLLSLWKGRPWVIAAIGADKQNHPTYGFSHQSFLEYFAAVYDSRASDTVTQLFDRLEERLLRLNGWLVAQMAISIWSLSHDKGATRFLEELLTRSSTYGPLDRLQLMRFGFEVTELGTVAKPTEARLWQVCLAIYASSVVLPEAGMSLRGSHIQSRVRHEQVAETGYSEFTEAYGSDDDDDPPPEFSGQLSTMDCEILVKEIAKRAPDPQLSRAVADFLASHPLPTGLVATAFLIFLAEAEGASALETRVAFRTVLAKYSSNDNWLPLGAGVALREIAVEGALDRIPWNAQFARDSLVLSLVRDFDLPALIVGDALTDYLTPRGVRHAKLESLGRSFKKSWLDKSVPWDPIERVDNALVGMNPVVSLPPISTSSWTSDQWHGAALLVFVFLELFGSEDLNHVEWTEHSAEFQWMLASIVDREVQPRTTDLELPDDVVKLIAGMIALPDGKLVDAGLPVD